MDAHNVTYEGVSLSDVPTSELHDCLNHGIGINKGTGDTEFDLEMCRLRIQIELIMRRNS